MIWIHGTVANYYDSQEQVAWKRLTNLIITLQAEQNVYELSVCIKLVYLMGNNYLLVQTANDMQIKLTSQVFT